jgi:hypothetical protein
MTILQHLTRCSRTNNFDKTQICVTNRRATQFLPHWQAILPSAMLLSRVSKCHSFLQMSVKCRETLSIIWWSSEELKYSDGRLFFFNYCSNIMRTTPSFCKKPVDMAAVCQVIHETEKKNYCDCHNSSEGSSDMEDLTDWQTHFVSTL